MGIPKYCKNKKDNFDIFEFINLMVDDGELSDIDNNNKYVALTIIVSIFKNQNLWTELESFMRELVDAQIFKNDVVEKWQLDDLDYEHYGHYIDKQYIDTSDLLQPNTNRSVSMHR